MSTSENLVGAADIRAAGLTEWTLADGVLRAEYAVADFAAALALANAVGAAAEEANHHPDLHVAWGRLGVDLTSHDAGGVTARDVALARTVTALAAQHGAEAAGA